MIDAEPEPVLKVNPKAPRDLATICEKSMAKEPARRYPTTLHLAEELTRWSDNKPIEARPIKTPERIWRWCRRKPVTAGLLATVGSLLLILVIAWPIVSFKQAKLRKAAQEAKADLDNQILKDAQSAG